MKKRFVKTVSLIFAISILLSLFPMNVFAGGMDSGLYGPIEQDESAPYMVIVKSGNNYYAYKSSAPIWYIYDENKLVVLENNATIKKFMYSSAEGLWKQQSVYSSVLNQKGYFNIDQDQSATFTLANITDYIGKVAGSISGETLDGTSFNNTYGDNILNHNVKPYLIIGSKQVLTNNKMRAEQVAAGLTISVLGLQEGDIPSAVTHSLNLQKSGKLYGYDYTIDWESTDNSIISAITGKVTRQDKDIDVRLAAIVRIQRASRDDFAIKHFYLTVKGTEESEVEAATRILDNLSVSDLGLASGEDPNNVKTNFTPIQSKTETVYKSDGSQESITYNIIWESSNSSVLSVTPGIGEVVVNRPSFSEGDKYVDLTATIDGISGPSRYFRLKVIKQPKSAADKAVDDLYSLTYDDILFAPGEDYMNVMSDFRLPLNKNGTDITWTVDGSNPAIVISEGVAKVTRPSNLQPDADVYLTASIPSGETMKFYIRVLKEPESDDVTIKRIIENIDVNYFTYSNKTTVIDPSDITDNFYVPVTIEGKTITWSPSDTTALVVNHLTGEVTVKRPKFGEGNKVVVLTASNNDTGTTYSHDFTFVVKQKEEAEADKNERVISGIGLAQLGDINTTSVQNNFHVSPSFGGSSLSWELDGQPVQGNTVSISGKDGTNELKVKVGESSKTFTINIKETASSPEERTAEAQKLFNEMAANYAKEMKYSDIGMSVTDRSIAVTKNLKLPSIAYTYNGKLYFGNNADLPSDPNAKRVANITWQSSDPTVISETGVVMRQTQDKTVVLTAVVVPETLEYDLDGDGIIGDGSIYDVTNNENRREFKLVVKNAGYNTFNETPQQKADRIASSIGVGVDQNGNNIGILLSFGDTMMGVKNDIQLISYFEDAAVRWTTTNPAIDPDTGKVTRPAAGSGNAVGEITATVTVDRATASKTFDITVLEEGNNTPVPDANDKAKADRIAKELGINALRLNIGDTAYIDRKVTLFGKIREFFTTLIAPEYEVVWTNPDYDIGVVSSDGIVIAAPKVISNEKQSTFEGKVKVNSQESEPFNIIVNMGRAMTLDGYGRDKKRYVSANEYFDEYGTFYSPSYSNNPVYFDSSGNKHDGEIPEDIDGIAGRKYNKYYDQSGLLRNNYIGDLIDTKVLEARKIIRELTYKDALNMDYTSAQNIRSDFVLSTSVEVDEINGTDLYDGTYDISWTSDKPGIVSISGGNASVTLPSSDTTIVLTPKVSFVVNGKTYDNTCVTLYEDSSRSSYLPVDLNSIELNKDAVNTFSIKVLSSSSDGTGETEAQRNARIANELDYRILGITENQFYTGLSVGDTLSLKTNYIDNGILYNNLITWGSNNTSVIDTDGRITYPTATEGSKIVRLTATVGGTATRTFDILVNAANTFTDLEKNQMAIRVLKVQDLVFASGEGINGAYNNITLPSSVSVNGVNVPITWKSAVPGRISDTGIINHTGQASDEYVRLTAVAGSEINSVAEFRQRNFEIRVLKDDPADKELKTGDYEFIRDNILNNSFIVINSNETLNTIVSPFKVKTKVLYKGQEVPLTWIDDSGFLTINGEDVTFTRRPSTENDVNIELKAMIANSGIVKIFNIRVLKEDESDNVLAERLAITYLSTRELGLAPNESPNKIVNQFKLKKYIPEYPQAVIEWNLSQLPDTWEIEDDAVNNPIIVTPKRAANDQTFNILATVRVGSATSAKTYSITVLGRPEPKPAVRVEINGSFIDRTVTPNVKLIQMIETDPNILNEQMYAVYYDEDNNAIDNGPALTWSIDGLVSGSGLSIDNNGRITVDRQELFDYRDSAFEFENAYGMFTLRVNGSGLTDGVITVDLQVERKPANKVEGELVFRKSFEPSLLYLGRYAPFVTTGVYDYRTLVNYGEYQLMFYTSRMPIIEYNADGTYLTFQSSTAGVDMQIYKAIGATGWEKLNDLKGVSTDTRIILDPNENCIEYINYDLKTASGMTILKANGNSNNDAIAPDYKLISLPNFSGISGNYKYIFVRGLSNYFLVSADSPITISGNDVIYPSNAKFYSLVQNRWVLNDDAGVAFNQYKFTDKVTFAYYLKYSSEDIQALGFSANIDEVDIGDPNYLSYFQEYSKTFQGNNYFIMNSPFYGIRAVEYPVVPVIEGGRIKFNLTAEQRGKVVEKIFSKGMWIDAPDATNIIDENGYYTRMDALSSIQYASTDLLDTNNKVVFDSRYKYNSAIYKVAGIVDKLPVSAPPNVSGKVVKMVALVDGVYKCYYSERPFYQEGNNIVIAKMSENFYAVDVYDFINGSWIKNENESKVYDLTNELTATIGNNLAANVKWTNTDITYLTDHDIIMIGAIPESVKFSEHGGILSVSTTDSTYGMQYPLYLLDYGNTSAYYLLRMDTVASVNTTTLKVMSISAIEGIMLVPKFDNWVAIMEIEASENAQISEIHDKNKYEINYTNPIGDTIVDNTRPVIKAAYLYQGNLYIYGADEVPNPNPDNEQASGIGRTGYGFEFGQATVLPFAISGIVNDAPKTFNAGETIPAGTTIWTSQTYMKMDLQNQAMKMTLWLADRVGNISTSRTVNLTKGSDNMILFGSNELPQEIKDLIDAANNEDVVDRDPPVIYGIYMYRDELYIVGEDLPVNGVPAVGLDQYPYGFKWVNPSGLTRYSFEITGLDRYGQTRRLEANTSIPNGFEIFKVESKQRIGRDSSTGMLIDSHIIVELRDANGNITVAGDPEGFYITHDMNNYVIWENPAYPNGIPEYIKNMLKAERDRISGGQDESTDKTPPEITGIYIYKGEIHVLARDNVKLHNLPYGFRFDTTVVAGMDMSGFSEGGDEVSVPAGTTIPSGTLIYRQVGTAKVSIPALVTFKVRDAAGNVTELQILITKENAVLVGEVPDYIEDIIKEEEGKNKNEDEIKDDKPPVITKVYTYQGKLYVEGFDADSGLAPFAYGFNPLEDMIISTDYVGVTEIGISVKIPANTIIPQYTEIYKKENFQEIMIPMYIEVMLRDNAGNITREKYFITKDNTSYKGDIPDGYEDIITPGDDRGNEGGGDIIVVPPGGGTGGGGSGGVIINPDENMENIDWSQYDYVVEVLEKDTERVVYRIRLDKAEQVMVPRLEDSTVYKIKQSAVSEKDGSVLYSKKDEVMTADVTPPVITSIVLKENRLYVNAYDKGGLAEYAYSFIIDGARNQKGEFVKENYKRVMENDIVIIQVRDKAGNVASVTINLLESTLPEKLKNVNVNNPLMLNQGETQSVSYWLTLLKNKFNLTGDYRIFEGVNVSFSGNDMTITGSGKFIIRLQDLETGQIIDILAKTLNAGSSNRTVVVQLGSELNFILAFKDKLMEEFGTINGITWYADEKYVSRDDSMVTADKIGVGTVTASKGGKTVKFYVVVTDDIKNLNSVYSFSENKFPYTFLVGTTFKLSDVLMTTTTDLKNAKQQGEFIIFEGASSDIKKDGDVVTLTAKGRKTIQLLNVVKDELNTIEFEVVELSPQLPRYIDVSDSWVKPYLADLTTIGILDYPEDGRFKPENGITIKEFLSIVNKLKMAMLEIIPSVKKEKTIPLSKKDWDYFGSCNMLIGLTENEINEIFGKNSSFNRAITRKEAVQVLSRTIFENEYHNEANNPVFKDVNADEKWVDDLNHLLSLKIISGAEKFRPYDLLKRSEMAVMLSRAINYLKEPIE